MAKILVINSTVIANENSYSTALLNKFVEIYKKNNSSDEIINLNISDIDISQKTLTQKTFSTFFNEKDTDTYINQLKEVDKVIIAAPMLNFNIPAALKNYLDHILVADKTFSYKYAKKGSSIGLLTKLKVQIITTQGAPEGWYPFANLGVYLKGVFEFVGASVAEPLVFSGTKVEPYNKLKPSEVVEKEISKIEKAVKGF